MAFIQCDFFSEALEICCSMWVVLPQQTRAQIGMSGVARGTPRHPVLYLLHGLSDDHSIWMRRTSIERHVADSGLAVVMPAVNRSFYTDMKRGYKYWTFISEEVPALACQFFPLSDKREDSFVAGISMGGYGAFKLALALPHRYAAAASLSVALDMATPIDTGDPNGIRKDLDLVFEDPDTISGSEHDLLYLASQLAKQKTLAPKLYQWCGTEDFLYRHNITFRDHAKRAGLPLEYHESPGGHTWDQWDMQIKKVIDWLPIKQ